MNVLINSLVGLGLIGLVAVSVSLLGPILTPFFLGAFLAYLGDPWVDRFEAWGLGRALSATLVFALIAAVMLAALMLFLPLLALELSELLQGLPASFLWLQSTLGPLIQDWTGFNLQALDLKGLAQNFLGEWQQSSDIMGYLLGQITQSGLAIFGSLMTLALTPVVAFYLMRDWDHLLTRLDQLIPRPQINVVRQLTAAGDEMLAAFIRGQFLVMILLGIFYAVGLGLVGLDMALIIGLIAGLASIVPYLGFILGLLMATIAAAYQFQDWVHPVYVLTVFILGQILEGSLLTPWLVGDRIGLHPVAVIFAVLAGGQLFGFIGVLLALPVAAVLMVLVRYWLGRYLASGFYLGDAVPATCDLSEEGAALDTPPAATIESETIDPDMVSEATDASTL
ncbi:MAG: AI-2E family transporter [Gammaproteobacteria bacterium]|nr:AI-2E family transporter [Gammaproteobacteria bacterium]